MEQLKERFLRPCRKLTDQFLIAGILTYIVMEVGAGLAGIPLMALGVLQSEALPSYFSWSINYFAFAGIWVVFLIIMAVFPANRPMLRRLLPTLREGNTLTRTLLGFLAGFVCNGLCVAISVLRHDIALSFVGFDVVPLLVLLCGVMIQSGAEELVTRVYLQQKFLRRYKSRLLAVVFSAVFFAAMHLGNPGITPVAVAQLLIIGLLLSVFCLYFDAFGAAVGMHTAWNYTQNIIFGCPNSGLVSEYSIFKLEAAANGPFFDTVFGVESSVGAVGVLLAFLVLMVVYVKVKHVKPIDIWADAEAKALAEQGAAPAPSGPRHMA